MKYHIMNTVGTAALVLGGLLILGALGGSDANTLTMDKTLLLVCIGAGIAFVGGWLFKTAYERGE